MQYLNKRKATAHLYAKMDNNEIGHQIMEKFRRITKFNKKVTIQTKEPQLATTKEKEVFNAVLVSFYYIYFVQWDVYQSILFQHAEVLFRRTATQSIEQFKRKLSLKIFRLGGLKEFFFTIFNSFLKTIYLQVQLTQKHPYTYIPVSAFFAAKKMMS